MFEKSQQADWDVVLRAEADGRKQSRLVMYLHHQEDMNIHS